MDLFGNPYAPSPRPSRSLFSLNFWTRAARWDSYSLGGLLEMAELGLLELLAYPLWRDQGETFFLYFRGQMGLKGQLSPTL